MSMNYKNVLWVLLLFLISSTSSSKLDKIEFDSIEEERELVDEQVKIQEDQLEVTEPTKMKKRFIHNDDEKTKLTDDQKYCVYAGLYPVVSNYCHSYPISITRLITDFLWHPGMERIFTIPGLYWVKMCHLSSDNMWLASQSNCRDISLWDVTSNTRPLWTVTTHNKFTDQCIVSTDHQYIISPSHDKTLKIWSFLTGTLLYTLEGHTGSVHGCSLSVDNQFLVSISFDATVRRLSMRTGQCRNVFEHHNENDMDSVWWAQIYANNRRVVTAGVDIRIWDVETNQCVDVLRGHTAIIRAGTFSGDEQRLLSVSDDRTAKVWELATGACIQTFTGHTTIVCSTCFVKNDTWVASIDRNGTVCTWRISDAYCGHRFFNYNFAIALPNSYWLRSTCTEYIIVSTKYSPYEVHVLAIESGEKIYTFAGHTRLINSVFVSADGKYLTSGSDNGSIRIFVFSEHN